MALFVLLRLVISSYLWIIQNSPRNQSQGLKRNKSGNDDDLYVLGISKKKKKIIYCIFFPPITIIISILHKRLCVYFALYLSVFYLFIYLFGQMHFNFLYFGHDPPPHNFLYIFILIYTLMHSYFIKTVCVKYHTVL